MGERGREREIYCVCVIEEQKELEKKSTLKGIVTISNSIEVIVSKETVIYNQELLKK